MKAKGTVKQKANKKYTSSKVLKFMLKTAWKNKPYVFVFYFISLISDLASIARDLILPKFILDELVLFINGAGSKQHLRSVAFYALLTCIFTVLTNLLSSVSNHATSALSVWFDAFFEEELTSHTIAMDFEHTENPEALEQLNCAKEGISWYSQGVIGILSCFYNIVKNAIIILGVATIILLTCPILFPVQLLSLALISYLNAQNNKCDVESFLKLAKDNRLFGYFFFQIADFRLGKDIRLYDSADLMTQKASEYSDGQIAIWAETTRKKRKKLWAMDIINALRDGISYFYIGYLALKKTISIGDFSMYISSASTLYWSLSHIITSIQDMNKKSRYASEFMKFLDYPSAMANGSKEINGKTHTIEFSHVSFKYPRTNNYILRDLSIKITSGEHLSIVGLNGAGKTTFIKLLCRLYEVNEGEILVDGINIKEYSKEEYHKLFAVVFQDFKLFAFSLKENIALDENINEEEVERALRLTGFYEESQKLENGLDTIIFKSFDEDGTELSGGQQQKVAISRALYKNAPIVILDEPTAALDPIAEYDIYKQFSNLVGGKTAIYISHRLSSCKFCDKIAVFAEDTIKEYGTHEELVSKPNGIYAEMFAAQAQHYILQ